MDMKAFSKLWSVGDWEDVLSVVADKATTFMRSVNAERESEKNLLSRVEKALFTQACKTRKDIKLVQILSVSLVKSRKTKDWHYSSINSI